jgi:hypothetical protein
MRLEHAKRIQKVGEIIQSKLHTRSSGNQELDLAHCSPTDCGYNGKDRAYKRFAGLVFTSLRVLKYYSIILYSEATKLVCRIKLKVDISENSYIYASAF